MLKRTMAITRPYHLGCRLKQLVLTSKDTGEESHRSIEDVGYLILEHPQITFTQVLMRVLAENNVAVIFCDEKYHPTSLLLHLDTHYIQQERFREQLESTEPLKKQLWQQTIKAKLWNQAHLLDLVGEDGTALRHIVKEVKSGDTTNREAWGAKIYWSRLFGSDFTRDRAGEMPNPALNYGYAILRAAVARALAGAGLLPTLGIHHRNRYNAYCLADDLMEPYRPLVDWLVADMYEEIKGSDLLEKEHRQVLMGLLQMDVLLEKQTKPLALALQRSAYALAQCFKGERRKLLFAQLPF